MKEVLRQGGEMRVSFGAGRVKIDGFKKVDLDPSSSPDYIMDVRSLQFEPQSIDVIYASHVFEHLRSDDTDMSAGRKEFLLSVLKSWRHCLTSNGRLYICVPDLEKLAKLICDYPNNESVQQIALDAVYGGARNSFDYHYSGFTPAILTTLLLEAGFAKIETFDPFVDDESTHQINGTAISLNIVAHNTNQSTAPQEFEKLTAKDTSELAMYRDAADERLKEILNLKKICDERLELIFKLSAQLEGQDVKPKKVLEEILIRIRRKFK